jgi:cytochrome c nitrite reductase small subunit
MSFAKLQFAGIVNCEACAVFSLCGPTELMAQQGMYQRDPVDVYAARLLTVMIALGIGLVLYSMVRYRGIVGGPVAWGLVIAGAGVLPLLMTGMGMTLVFERVKTVQLCGSCHLTMKAYVDDMKNPQSRSMAAIHFTNRYIAEDQCYVCHTAYGLLGTFEAKEQGVIDVYKYYTRTFEFPLKLRHPYRDRDCLKCHAEATKFLEAHQDSKEEIFAGKLTCMQCHSETHPAHIVAQTSQRANP